ncbi:unnamed protein product [Cladocopium goreaui]|uniref:Glutathione S-transferase DHAR2 n=1 Tax=Cladocopium goreaui TaxID=2562237 RepID=A0A9P1DMP9_9DINO|nr:unnamed protein product [Cladocopium goreaui]
MPRRLTDRHWHPSAGWKCCVKEMDLDSKKTWKSSSICRSCVSRGSHRCVVSKRGSTTGSAGCWRFSTGLETSQNVHEAPQGRRPQRLRGTVKSVVILAALALRGWLQRSFCQSCRSCFRPTPCTATPRTCRYATPLELLALPPLETYTSKGVLPAPGPTLPEGKQSVFDGVPLMQTDQGVQADGLLEKFAQRLVAEAEPLDVLSTLLLFLALSLGFLDTPKRWFSYASDFIIWGIYQVIPGEKLFPARLGPGDPQDVEKAEAPGVDRYEDFPSEVLTLWGNFM